MSRDEPRLLAFPIDVRCMIEAHGRLYTYVDVNGNLSVRACDKCVAEPLESFKDELRLAVRASDRGGNPTERPDESDLT